MMRNLMAEGFMMMLQDLMMITMMKLILESFMLIFWKVSDFDYDVEFNSIRFYDVIKNYERTGSRYHYTDKYRGAAHSICNLRYKTQK